MNFERVTKSTTKQNLLSYLDASQRRLSQRQEQVASGRQFNFASESPPEAAQVMAHRRQLQRMEQYARNGDSARGWLDTSASALGQASDVITSARTLVVQGMNSSQSPSSRAAVAAEIHAMAEQLLSVANTTANGRPLFGATTGGERAFADDGRYVGGGAAVQRAVAPGQIFDVGRPGPATFGSHHPTDPLQGNAIQVLRAAAEAVLAGDTTTMDQALGAIDGAHETVLAEVGRLGSLGVRLEGLVEQRTLQQLDTKRQLSQVHDVDLAEGLLNLRGAEAAHETALAATAKLLGASLLDFLR